MNVIREKRIWLLVCSMNSAVVHKLPSLCTLTKYCDWVERNNINSISHLEFCPFLKGNLRTHAQIEKVDFRLKRWWWNKPRNWLDETRTTTRQAPVWIIQNLINPLNWISIHTQLVGNRLTLFEDFRDENITQNKVKYQKCTTVRDDTKFFYFYQVFFKLQKIKANGYSF